MAGVLSKEEKKASLKKVSDAIRAYRFFVEDLNEETRRNKEIQMKILDMVKKINDKYAEAAKLTGVTRIVVTSSNDADQLAQILNVIHEHEFKMH
jgi:hypothetical protein